MGALHRFIRMGDSPLLTPSMLQFTSNRPKPMTDLQTRCLELAEELSDFGIDRVDQGDLYLAFEGLTESNLYATAEAIASLGDWFN